MRSKKSLQMFEESSLMTDVATAADLANRLVVNEARGPGDLDNAMRRIEAKYGVPYSLLWALRYRRPADILLSAWVRLVSAYEVECARQRRLWEAEQARTEAINNAASKALDRAAAGVARSEDSGGS